jgi:hypothetical protein
VSGAYVEDADVDYAVVIFGFGAFDVAGNFAD